MKLRTRRRLCRAWRWLRHPLGLVGYGVIGVVTIAMMVAVARSEDLPLLPLFKIQSATSNNNITYNYGPPDIIFPDIMVIHTNERRIEVMPGVEADEAARAVLRALEAYLPAPCKEP